MKEDLKKFRDMNKYGTNSQDNVVKSVKDEDDVFLATNDEVAKTKWVMDSAASKHICKDREMFDTLKIVGEFGHYKLGNGGKGRGSTCDDRLASVWKLDIPSKAKNFVVEIIKK